MVLSGIERERNREKEEAMCSSALLFNRMNLLAEFSQNKLGQSPLLRSPKVRFFQRFLTSFIWTPSPPSPPPLSCFICSDCRRSMMKFHFNACTAQEKKNWTKSGLLVLHAIEKKLMTRTLDGEHNETLMNFGWSKEGDEEEDDDVDHAFVVVVVMIQPTSQPASHSVGRLVGWLVGLLANLCTVRVTSFSSTQISSAQQGLM